MREHYENYKPNKASLQLIKQTHLIIREYQRQGFVLTLRQLYYQLVSRDIVPNTERSYKNVGTIVSKARMAGFLDWDAIEDRARQPKSASQWDNIGGIVDSAVRSYRLPRMSDQELYVELWVEKDALAGVLWPIAYERHITLMVNRGYSSASAMRESAERIRRSCRVGGQEEAVILYLGDLDPSGEDMVRDIDDRLRLFLNEGRLIRGEVFAGTPVGIETWEEQGKRKPTIGLSVEKLALTEEQVEEHGPPPNPAKLTDPRAAAFVEKFGDHSWEVDALPPAVLKDIIETRLDELIDQDKVDAWIAREETDKAKLRKAAGAKAKR